MLGNDNKHLPIKTLDSLAPFADYSLMDTLNRDPHARENGADHSPRQVFSGHYVPVTPTPIENPEYIAHSKTLFRELNFDDSLAQSNDFMAMFSGDLSQAPEPLRKVGWACGYALSIYGSEYYHQCPFQTGNGYGDGRAMSVLEAVINGKRWEMQLKGGGRTPYCRGADGRAVLRSSVREFLAQEHMHALGVPTSRSLSLYVSKTEKVQRPWYSEGSRSENPDIQVLDPVAISTRVASSFIRVGQLELFGRRARKNEHPQAMQELEQIVLHLIDREYANEIDSALSLPDKVILLASLFRNRLTALVANWIRVGYCHGNFNSDNCAAGGFTLDYGPFGFLDAFDPRFQPWTGGGEHFSFLNQPKAAERNYYSFCTALQPLLASHKGHMQQLIELHGGFSAAMQAEMERMWAAKLGLSTYNDALFKELASLMTEAQVDYTLFFRELSALPESIEPLKTSFYRAVSPGQPNNERLNQRWAEWLHRWQAFVAAEVSEQNTPTDIAEQMKRVNPKYTMREWFVVPAYQQAMQGDYALVHELQTIMTQPYAEQSTDVVNHYFRLKPLALFQTGGLSHYSCSS